MGITMVRSFVRAAGRVTIEHALDHIDHLTRLAGVEHAGIGSDVDLDGRDRLVRPTRRFDLDGIDYVKKTYDLTEGLVSRNYSSRNIELILGGTFARALTETWTVQAEPHSSWRNQSPRKLQGEGDLRPAAARLTGPRAAPIILIRGRVRQYGRP